MTMTRSANEPASSRGGCTRERPLGLSSSGSGGVRGLRSLDFASSSAGAADDSDGGCNDNDDGRGHACAAATAQDARVAEDEDGLAAPLPSLVRSFDDDGLLVLPSLLTPKFAARLGKECAGLFDGVLEWLHARGEVHFASGRRRRSGGQRSRDGSRDESGEAEYEYPLGQGVKHGYRELVMRSPGRYELALLLDELPDHCRGRGDGGADYNDRWLLTPDMLKCNEGEGMVEDDEVQESSYDGNCRVSCLKQLLVWVQSGQSDKRGNFNNQHDQYPTDRKNIERFMELIGAIFPAEGGPDDNRENVQNVANSPCDNQCDNQSGLNTKRDRDDYYLCHLSLLLSTPGCPEQPWHADGGHVSIDSHKRCHALNVFIPLVEVRSNMGPTELRPGTHYHTRRLGPMMLAARARGTLRPPVAPTLGKGGGLLFDYRILHRGRANTSDAAVDGDGDDDRRKEDCSEGSDGAAYGDGRGDGKDRPVLVLTFARGWYVDVCNFPKRSVFAPRQK